MSQISVCPYFGLDEDSCDVGCGYISPHDVKIISRFCSGGYRDCLKFRELEERRSQGVPLPKKISREAIMATSAPPALEFSPGHHAGALLAPMGLLGFSLCAILLNVHALNLFPLDPLVLGIGLIYGGVWQVVVGLLELKRNRSFNAVVFTAYGLFWLSLVALVVFPQAGVGAAPQPASIISYLGIWALFSLGLALGVEGALRLRIIFGLIFLYLAVQAGAEGYPLSALDTAAGYAGILCGLAAGGFGMSLLADSLKGRLATSAETPR